MGEEEENKEGEGGRGRRHLLGLHDGLEIRAAVLHRNVPEGVN